jgi:putative hemolysin
MFRKWMLILIVLLLVVTMSACKRDQTTSGAEVKLANPASVYCEQNGGKVEMRTDASGGQAGICVFPDGSECDEWAYYRDECSPGQ